MRQKKLEPFRDTLEGEAPLGASDYDAYSGIEDPLLMLGDTSVNDRAASVAIGAVFEGELRTATPPQPTQVRMQMTPGVARIQERRPGALMGREKFTLHCLQQKFLRARAPS